MIGSSGSELTQVLVTLELELVQVLRGELGASTGFLDGGLKGFEVEAARTVLTHGWLPLVFGLVVEPFLHFFKIKELGPEVKWCYITS